MGNKICSKCKGLYIALSILIGILAVILFCPGILWKSEVENEITDYTTIDTANYEIDGQNFICQSDDPQSMMDAGYSDEIRLIFDPVSLDKNGVIVQLFCTEGTEALPPETQIATKVNPTAIFKSDYIMGARVRIDIGDREGETFRLTAIQFVQHYISLSPATLGVLMLSIVICFFLICLFTRQNTLKALYNICKLPVRLLHSMLNRNSQVVVDGRNKIRNVGLAFFSQIVILSVLLLMQQIVYAVNDDTTMVAIAGGGYGEPSAYVINLHFALGYLLKNLFRYFTGINWITVLYLFTYLYSFFILDVTFFYKSQGRKRYLSYLILIDICFLICVSHFTFTVVAYCAFIAGFCILTCSMNLNRKKVHCFHVFGAFALLLGFLIRAEALKSILIVYFMYAVLQLFINKKIKYIGLLAFSAAIMYVAIQSNFMLHNLNPQEKTFLDWGETRSKALDSKKIEYNEAEFLDHGISKAQYDAIYNVFYYVRDAVSIQNMESLIQLNTILNKYNFDAAGFMIYYFSFIHDILSFNNLYKIVFLLVFVGSMLFGNKISRKYSIWVAVGTVAAEFVFFFINRSLYRVVMPTYIFAIFLTLLSFQKESIMIRDLYTKGIDWQGIVLKSLLLLVAVSIGERGLNHPMLRAADYSKERRQVLAYMEKEEDTLFLAGDANVFNIGVSRPIWQYAGENAKWNLIGNWETYSVVYDMLLDELGIQNKNNVAYEAVNNDKILILTSIGDEFTKHGEYILDLIQEYYGIRPEFVLKEEICTNPVTEYDAEHWQVYQLVY